MSKVLEMTCGDGKLAVGSIENKFIVYTPDEPGAPGDYCDLALAHEFLRVKFKNIESVDAWIEKLQEVREYLEQ